MWQGDGECDDVCNTETKNWDSGDCPTPTSPMDALRSRADSIARAQSQGTQGATGSSVSGAFNNLRPVSPAGRHVPQGSRNHWLPRLSARHTGTGGDADGGHGNGG